MVRSGRTVANFYFLLSNLSPSSLPPPASSLAVAPIKALCSERHEDWQARFGPLGLQCSELTGDTQLDDYFELKNAQIIMTTPVRE